MAKASNGGILGSGIFGFFGTTIQCQSTDNSIRQFIFCVIIYNWNYIFFV